MRVALTLTLTWLLAGCWSPRRVSDPGPVVCLDWMDGDVLVTVEAPCLSSTCTRNRRVSCTIEVEEDTLVVQASARWGTRVGPSVCSDDCAPPQQVSCTAPAEAGTWTLIYGDLEQPVVLPPERPCGAFGER